VKVSSLVECLDALGVSGPLDGPPENRLREEATLPKIMVMIRNIGAAGESYDFLQSSNSSTVTCTGNSR
jgi:hypothetical protein